MEEKISEVQNQNTEAKKGGAGMYYPVNIENIKENKENAVFDIKGIDELAENIEKYGLKEPPTVYKEGDYNILISGHRRFNACKKLFVQGKKIKFANKEYFNQIPCNFETKYEDSDEEFFNLASSNLNGRNLSVSEKKRMVERASKAYDNQLSKGTIKDKSKAEFISEKIGMPIRTVYDYLGINNGEEKTKKLMSVKAVENKINAFIEFLNSVEIDEYGKTDRTSLKERLNEVSSICKKKK